jgi:hypothetical protein
MTTTTINDFVVISKLGSYLLTHSSLIPIGTGAFSEVFRVRRKTDNIEYALKKVTT